MTTTVNQGQSFATKTLEHFGVKGMKWGVRKDRGHEGERVKNKKLPKLDKKFEKEAGSVKTFIAIHNSAAQKFNNQIDDLNNKPEYKDADFTRKSPLRDKYEAETQRMFLDNLHASAKEMGTNASGTKEYAIYEGDDDWQVYVKDVKHSATAIPMNVEMIVKLTRGKRGQIKSVTPEPPAQNGIKHEDSVDDFLAHYGVKGMRWGVRKDRSAQEVTVYTRPGKKAVASGGKNHKPTAEAMQTVATKQKSKRSTTDSLSNKELKEAVERMRLEQQYNKLTGDNLSLGQKFVKFLIDSYGDVSYDDIK